MNHTPTRRSLLAKLAILPLLAFLLTAGGCQNVIGWFAQVVGGGETTYAVDAKYRTLGGHSVAVVVEASQDIYFQYPSAPGTIQRAVTGEIRKFIPDVRLTDPVQIEKFQKENPNWTTLSYGDLLKRLGVERVVLIDMADYSLHEPGNANVWRGLASGTVGVLEDNAPNPNNFAFSESVEAQFPPDTKVGLLNGDDATVQLGLNKAFAQKVAFLFYDHKIKEKNN